MTKSITIIGLSLSALSLCAQTYSPQNELSKISVPSKTRLLSGFEIQQEESNNNGSSYQSIGSNGTRDIIEEKRGTTKYDLQTNSSLQQRLVNRNGVLGGVFTYSDNNQFTDRGTGYFFFDGSKWSEPPSSRIETVRTGWPSYMILENNKEVVIAHQASGSLVMSTRTFNAGEDWTRGQVPTATGENILWARATNGGADGNTIHCIAITAPIANDGKKYKGVDGQILYWRSKDGGTTWDIKDSVIPGLDSAHFNNFDGDAYSITAKQNTIAIGIWNDWADCIIMKSSDNGDTWNKKTIIDFPIDKWEELGNIWDGNNDSTTDADNDGKIDDEDKIHSTDRSGNITIDDEGMVHAVFGKMIYGDDNAGTDAATGQSSYFPFTSGVLYWNETFGKDSSILCADIVDEDGNGTIEFLNKTNSHGQYQNSLTSYPSIAIKDGELFVTYSGVVEGANNGSQMYRHVYITRSNDYGLTWCAPQDLTPEVDGDERECVFANLATNIDDKIHIIYQSDFEPGLAVRGDKDPVDENEIVYLTATLSDSCGIPLSINKIELNKFDQVVYPNPATNEVYISFNNPKGEELQLSLINSLGSQVKLIAGTNYKPSGNLVKIDLQDVKNGLYFVKLTSNTTTKTIKVVVSK